MSVASRRRARGMWLLSGFGGGGSGSGPSYDTDAQTYITAVEAADGQSLETGVKDAINAFVVGCKADGIWTAIKASCILAGARTLTGAFVPLVGTAPTNNNFVSGDYSRTAGLTGDGSTKYLNTNRNNNADPQNSFHMSCYLSAAGSANSVYIGAGPVTNETGASNMGRGATTIFSRNRIGGAFNSDVTGSVGTATGFMGNSRNISTSFVDRVSGTNSTKTATSQTPYDGLFSVFASSTGAARSNANICFYSIGESLDLALLDSRVTTLIAGMAFAVNTGLSPVGYSTETINYVNAGYAAGGTLA